MVTAWTAMAGVCANAILKRNLCKGLDISGTTEIIDDKISIKASMTNIDGKQVRMPNKMTIKLYAIIQSEDGTDFVGLH